MVRLGIKYITLQTSEYIQSLYIKENFQKVPEPSAGSQRQLDIPTRIGSQTSPEATPGAETFLLQRRTSRTKLVQLARKEKHGCPTLDIPSPYARAARAMITPPLASTGQDSTPKNRLHTRMER